MTANEGLAVLQEAASSPKGLLMSASNVEAVVAALARIAKTSGRPELLSLQFKRVTRPDGNLAIIHGPSLDEMGL